MRHASLLIDVRVGGLPQTSAGLAGVALRIVPDRALRLIVCGSIEESMAADSASSDPL